MSASLEEIKDFYERTQDNVERTEFIKSIFNHDYTELTLEDGRTVGYKTFQNVLHLWEGHYESRTKQSYYDWGVIARHFEAMRLLGELNDRMKPLPSMDGQLSFILDGQAGEEKTSAFSFSQEMILANIYLNIGISLLPVQQVVEKPIWPVLLAWKHVNGISLLNISAFQICSLILRLHGQKGATEKFWPNMPTHWCLSLMSGFF